MPVTGQVSSFPHHSSGIRETSQQKNKEEAGFLASRWESQVRKDSVLALCCDIQVPWTKRGFVCGRGKEEASLWGTRDRGRSHYMQQEWSKQGLTCRLYGSAPRERMEALALFKSLEICLDKASDHTVTKPSLLMPEEGQPKDQPVIPLQEWFPPGHSCWSIQLSQRIAQWAVMQPNAGRAILRAPCRLPSQYWEVWLIISPWCEFLPLPKQTAD